MRTLADPPGEPIGILCFVFDLAHIALLAWARMHPEALETGVDTRLVHA